MQEEVIEATSADGRIVCNPEIGYTQLHISDYVPSSRCPGSLGDVICRIWLPNHDAAVRILADELKPMGEMTMEQPDHISYVAGGSPNRRFDCLRYSSAPIESSVIPSSSDQGTITSACLVIESLSARRRGAWQDDRGGVDNARTKASRKGHHTVVAKGLVTQWVAEMRTHFNEEFRLLNPSEFSAYRSIIQEENIWRRFPQVVCPMDSVKPVDGRRGWSHEQLAQYNRERYEDLISAGWDLIVVDEAHRLGGSTEQVARYRLGRGLAEAAPYMLLLSATPHQGKSDAFHRLVSLLDECSFPDLESITKERVQPYVIRTEKRQAITATGSTVQTK